MNIRRVGNTPCWIRGGFPHSRSLKQQKINFRSQTAENEISFPNSRKFSANQNVSFSFGNHYCYHYSMQEISLYIKFQLHGRNSSVGRALDQKSKGSRFHPGALRVFLSMKEIREDLRSPPVFVRAPPYIFFRKRPNDNPPSFGHTPLKKPKSTPERNVFLRIRRKSGVINYKNRG